MKKILIIDDDKVVAKIFKGAFQAEGYEVEIANDGEAGLARLPEFQPDLLLLDLGLPKLSGVGVIKHLRKQDETRDLPIVVLSNAYLSKVMEEAWQAGANKCLKKTYCTPKKLLEEISRLFEELEVADQPEDQDQPFELPPSDSPTAFFSQNTLRQGFFKLAQTSLEQARLSLAAISEPADPRSQREDLEAMRQNISSLASSAGVAGYADLAQMASALEALLTELHQEPKKITISSLRTADQAVTFLGELADHLEASPDGQVILPPNILVVDDDIISRDMIMFALQKAGLNSVGTDSPESALDLIKLNRFNLIFLDVNMPGMNGYEVCTQLRKISNYQDIPVVFVTALSDFESRARSTVSGGNDLIAKPFLLVELAVKALIHLHAHRTTDKAAKPDSKAA